MKKRNDKIKRKYVILAIHILLALKFYFYCENLCFLVKNAFFTISESKTRKKSKILLKGYSIG